MAQQEINRLREAREETAPWKKWGPYLSERQWGTVREDYSADGNAWSYFSHDQARSRAYKWGEDGLAGVSDDQQILCFALGLWNGKDPILKERLFGLTNSEGNHGEDVKEYYFYLDSTPTHSYMKYLYKYPQAAYPYDQLVSTNKGRSREEMEYELLDTGVFDDDRYYDVFVEYAKESAEDMLIAVHIANRGPEAATLHVLPTLWFRNRWSWGRSDVKPSLRAVDGPAGTSVIAAEQDELGKRWLYCDGAPELIFTDNETNRERIHGEPNPSPYVKDAFDRYVVRGETGAVNPAKEGTKATPHYVVTVEPGQTVTLRLRLTDVAPPAVTKTYGKGKGVFGAHFDEALAARLQDADEFYDAVTPDKLPEDAARVMRQALAGMLWSKQFYYYDLDFWLEESGAHPWAPNPRASVRNQQWYHMVNADVISMPDKWEYPWYAAWDLAFHTVALALVDTDFAKRQLDLFLSERYQHPSGQIPAYEWNFGDVNPPVHAWATLFVYRLDAEINGQPDTAFLQQSFQKLLMNFTWWLNRKDRNGRNVFEGGFLGLDNIGVFDRSAPLPTGGYLEQADGTAWMAFYSQNMLEIALELLPSDPQTYSTMVGRFFRHFLYIAAAMDRIGDQRDEMWDEQDGFFYDVLRLPDGTATRLKVRSMVGLLPLVATTVIEPEALELLPDVRGEIATFMAKYPELSANIAMPNAPGKDGRFILSLFNEKKLRSVLAYLFDENEFLSQYGIRALSRYHLEHPYVFRIGHDEHRVDYLPAESNNGMFGGNSNWRGPIWMPVNLLLWRSLVQLYTYYGDDFKVEFPTGSGNFVSLYQASLEVGKRLSAIFMLDQDGKRPVFGGSQKFQNDPHWRDNILFYEYFHGDNGAGLGASHQTGWTGTVARMIQFYGHVTKSELLEEGWKENLAYTEELEQ